MVGAYWRAIRNCSCAAGPFILVLSNWSLVIGIFVSSLSLACLTCTYANSSKAQTEAAMRGISSLNEHGFHPSKTEAADHDHPDIQFCQFCHWSTTKHRAIRSHRYKGHGARRLRSMV